MSLESRINQLMKKALEQEQPVDEAGELDFSRMSDEELAKLVGRDITKEIASMSDVSSSDEPIYIMWLPVECVSLEEWMSRVANPAQPCEWVAISRKGVEQIYYGTTPPLN